MSHYKLDEVTPVVTFNPDNTITLNTKPQLLGWPAWRSIIYDLVGVDIRYKDRAFWVQDRRDGYWYKLPKNKQVRFERIEAAGYPNGCYNVKRKLPLPTVAVVNRKAMCALRVKIKPFMQYARNMFRLLRVVIPEDPKNMYIDVEPHLAGLPMNVYARPFDRNWDAEVKDITYITLTMSADMSEEKSLAKYAEALTALCKRTYLRDRTSHWRYSPTDYRRNHKTITFAMFRKYVKILLLTKHSDELLELKSVYAKRPLYDMNSKYRLGRNI
jgi:hypothetical protein